MFTTSGSCRRYCRGWSSWQRSLRPLDTWGNGSHHLRRVSSAVLLTHHHRDTAAWVARHLAAGVTVRAPKASEPWLSPAGVRQYWRESLPLRSSWIGHDWRPAPVLWARA